MNMPTTMARVAVPLSASSSVGSCDIALAGSAAKDARGEHTAAAVARAAAAGVAAGKPDLALIWTACFIATIFFEVSRSPTDSNGHEWGWVGKLVLRKVDKQFVRCG